MHKREFVALADRLRSERESDGLLSDLSPEHYEDVLSTLAGFCASTNDRFMRERWLSYVRGECGPNGGSK